MTAQSKPKLATKPLLSIDETAILLGTSRSALYRAIEKGDFPLPLVEMAGRRRVPRVAVERLLRGEPLDGPVSSDNEPRLRDTEVLTTEQRAVLCRALRYYRDHFLVSARRFNAEPVNEESDVLGQVEQWIDAMPPCDGRRPGI